MTISPESLREVLPGSLLVEQRRRPEKQINYRRIFCWPNFAEWKLKSKTENALRITKQKHEMEFKRLEEEQNLEVKSLCEENKRKLTEGRQHETEQVVDVSHANQSLSDEVSQSNINDDTQGNRVDQG